MIITALWATQPGQFFCLCTKSASGKWSEHFFKRGKWREVDRFVKDNDDKDIYFCPHGFKEKRRKKFTAEMPNMFWSDMDEVDPRTCKPKPTIAFESSPGRYVGLWLIDKPATEQLNKRLTYHIGADQGGWDVTQVLRVPGTTNYKYQSTPKVRVLWDDGPTYKRSKLENTLPELEDEEGEDAQKSDAYKIIKDYERVLDGPTRRDLLLQTLPPNVDRSKVIWRLNHKLRDAGMDSDEIFIVLKASVWNKWRGRDVENKRLREEIAKVLGQKIKAKAGNDDDEDDDDSPRTDHVYLSQSLDEVEEEDIDWIWYPYLARGEVTIVEGDPGIGKSYLMQVVAKHLCDGERIPSPKKLPVCQGKVAYFDVENSRATVTKKRLKGIECPENFFQEEEPFTIDDIKVMKRVHQALEHHRPVLVVFDTINLYIGGIDINKSNEVTQALVPFKEMARRYKCAVVLLRHLTKGGGKSIDALYRGQGNIAFAGVSRILCTVGRLPDDPDTKALAVTKTNLAPVPRVLSFNVEALPDTMKEMDRSAFHWGQFLDGVSSNDILTAGKPEKSTMITDAIKFLEDIFEDADEIDALKVQTMAEKRSITTATLQRAKDKVEGMVIQTKKVGGVGDKRAKWVWRVAKRK